MKKGVLFAALSSAVLGAGAASAFPVGRAHIVNVNIAGPASAGTITSGGVLATGPLLDNRCAYPSFWQSPFSNGSAVLCTLLETRSFTNPSCEASARAFTPGAFLSTVPSPGPFLKKGGVGTGCAGFDPNGLQYLSEIVISAVEGIDRASGTITYPAPFGGPYELTL